MYCNGGWGGLKVSIEVRLAFYSDGFTSSEAKIND